MRILNTLHHLYIIVQHPPPEKWEKQKTIYIVSLSGGHRTLVERLVGGISTVTVGSDNAKSITSSST